jgi:hypothetical protein
VKGFSSSKKLQNMLLFPISLQNVWVLKLKDFPSMGVKEAQERQ